MSWNRDLTLDEALADPMIAAVLRADRVDSRQFETLLRTAARRLGAGGRAPAPVHAPGAAPPREGGGAGLPDGWTHRPGSAARPAAHLAARACRPAAGDRPAW